VTTDAGPSLVYLAWIVSLLVLVRLAWRKQSRVAGLALAYWVQLFTIHGLSHVLHSWSTQLAGEREVSLVGFEVTGYALAGLTVGCFLANYFQSGKSELRTPKSEIHGRPSDFGFRTSDSELGSQRPESRLPDPNIERPPGLLFVLVGLGLYTIAGRLLPRIPGTDAVLSSGFSLAVAGFALAWYASWKAAYHLRAWLILISALVVPVLTVSMSGFLGFGVSFLVSLACFVAAHYRPRWRLVLMAPLVVFAGVSLFPAYMVTRTEIRKAVWGGAGYSERFEKMYLMLTQYQAFDPDSKAHLEAIDARLNQDILLGRAVQYLESGRTEYAQGETLWNALVAMIPRAVWPDKPVYAGSGGLVTRFTGLTFAKGTSVGIGQVMELYVNFGRAGVLAGYLLLGLLLGWLDARAGAALVTGRWGQFTLWFMVGLAFLHVGGNFAEATASAAGCLVLWALIHAFLGGPRTLPQDAANPAPSL
jgi:hypothetical protein